MAAADRLTLLELANRTNNKEIIEISEVLTEENDILKDAVWVEANQFTTHVHTRRTTLAYGTVTRINKGTPKESTTTKQIAEPICIVEGRSEIDTRLLRISRNKIKTRTDEDKGFLEGMGQTFADIFFYGTKVDNPDGVNGLATRMPSLGGTVLGCSGTGSDLSSIYAVQWGQNKVHFIYPAGSETMGIEKQDLGEIDVLDADGLPFRAYVTIFRFNVGISVHDDRCMGRLANIETSGSTNIFAPATLNSMLSKMKNRGKGVTLYMNDTILTQIENAAMDKDNVTWPVKMPFGDEVISYRGHPMRQANAILDTEDAITA